MAVTHIGVNDATTHGRLLRQTMNNLEAAVVNLSDLISTMSLMLSGDGTQPAHYSYVTSHFGFADDATSQAAFNELNALYLKLNTDASVTNVKTAISQALAKFR